MEITIESLVEALEPFHLEAKMWAGLVKDDRSIITISDPQDLDEIDSERYLTVGDLRRLSSLYTALKAFLEKELERKA